MSASKAVDFQQDRITCGRRCRPAVLRRVSRVASVCVVHVRDEPGLQELSESRWGTTVDQWLMQIADSELARECVPPVRIS